MSDSEVAIRSFKDLSVASEAAAHLRRVGVRCSLLSKHTNIRSNIWLLVPQDQELVARQTMENLPSAFLKNTVRLASIPQADISVYARTMADRYRQRWIVWAFILIWPVGFLRVGLWWGVASISVFLLVLALLSKTICCPCCRSFPVSTVPEESSRQCSHCGISFGVVAELP